VEKRRPQEKAVQKPRPQTRSKQTKQDRKRDNFDVRPNAQETAVARGAFRPGGSSEFFPDGDPDEAVVDLNSREEKYFSYLLHLKQKIEGVWSYPQAAARAGLGGQLTVEFIIANDGELMGVRLLDSSRHTILDESAMRAIKSAAPYHAFPPTLKAKRIRIRANFIYVTNDFFRRIL
jgi:periplasmic protein TonB